jgi:riboflavin kinase/FMN adenylyltransferase
MSTFTSFEQFAQDGAKIAQARPVVTVGSFDGLHLGHIYLIDELIELARREQAPSVVVTFSMHPREFITRQPMPALTSPEHKRKLLLAHGVDAVLLMDFNSELQKLSAAEFLKRCVLGSLNARALLVGYNNRIGKDGEGTFPVLKALGEQQGLRVIEAERVEVSGHAMSSSAIRQHVQNGDFLWARKMLGRPYSIVGCVQKGDQRGRTIGFPTANISLAGLATPPRGVYGVRVWLDAKAHLGAANIGVRPTVDAARTDALLEVHVLDFNGDLYGREVEVEFLFRVRDERKFDSLQSLKEQLAADVAEIRKRAVE